MIIFGISSLLHSILAPEFGQFFRSTPQRYRCSKALTRPGTLSLGEERLRTRDSLSASDVAAFVSGKEDWQIASNFHQELTVAFLTLRGKEKKKNWLNLSLQLRCERKRSSDWKKTGHVPCKKTAQEVTHQDGPHRMLVAVATLEQQN